MKRKIAGKNIHKPISKGEFATKLNKRRSNFIKPIVHIHDWIFDI